MPLEIKDRVGHADGCVRFVNDHTVLINSYSNENSLYYKEFEMSLRNAGLDIIKIPYNPYSNKKIEDATGLYINYLQMKDIIFLQVFGLKEDDIACKQFENIFQQFKIIPVYSNKISTQGGVLNCISWNIFK